MLTSRMTATFDVPWFDASFDFWEVRTERDHISHYSDVGDLPSASDKVLAASFDTGAQCWLMVPSGAFGGTDMAALVHGLNDDTLTCEQVSAGDVPQRNLLQLCINSIAKSRYDADPVGNIAGALTVPVPSTYAVRNGHLDCFAAVRVVVGRDMSLRLPVATFTSLDNWFPEKRNGEKLYPVLALPRYRFANGNRLVRDKSIGDHDPMGFVERQKHANRRSSVAFLGLRSASYGGPMRKELFAESKIGILHAVLRRVAKRYGDHLDISFEDVPSAVRLDVADRDDDAWRSRTASALGGRVRVVDLAGSPDKAGILVSHLRGSFGLDVSIGEAAPADGVAAPVLALVHEAEWYGEDGADPYATVDFGADPVQHIAVETLKGKKSDGARIDLAVSDLAVKADIAAGSMRLADWPALGLSGTWSFGYRIAGDFADIPPVASMTVSDAGNLSFSLDAQGGFFGFPDDPLVSLAREHPRSLVIGTDGGDLGLIDRTDSFAMPEVFRIGGYFDGRLLPGEKVQDTLPKGLVENGDGVSSFDYRLKAMAGIEGAVIDSQHGLYKVAESPKAIKTSVSRAVVLRSIEAVEGRLLLGEVCRLTNVDFVRLHRPTVIPFPYKYLREWLRMEHPELA